MNRTADIDPTFDRAFITACIKIECNPLDLLGVMFSESGCKPAARNPNGNASGLIQFMPATLRGLGWRDGDAAFRHLSASQQLPYVIAYYQSWSKTGKPWDSAGRLYQATFLPGTLSSQRAAEDVLCGRDRLGWAYSANAAFDRNGDGRITIGELTASVERAAKGSRWAEMLGRLGFEVPPIDLADKDGDGIPDLSTAAEVQEALNRLGFDAGLADGIPGPRTTAAVRAFQSAHELRVDGIAGPKTRSELGLALATAA